MAFDKNIPCTKECKDRSYTFCKSCEKLKEYKEQKAIEYEQRAIKSMQDEDNFAIVNKRVDLFNKKRKKR